MKKLFKKIQQYKIFQRKLPLFLAVIGLVITTGIFLVIKYQNPSQASWFAGGVWQYRKAITVDNNKVSGTSTLANFPMLYSVTDADLKYTGSGGNVGKSDGSDILFTSSDGVTKLFHEIEYYASTTGEIVAWVKIPSLSNSVDTTIYIYYGNVSAPDQQDAANVWESNYKAVWHMGDGDSTAANFYKDSTINANHGQLTDSSGGTAQASGKMGQALDFQGDADVLSIAADTSLNLVNNGDYTLEAWLYPSWASEAAVDTVFAQADGSGTGRSILFLDLAEANSSVEPNEYVSYLGASFKQSDISAAINTWQHVVFTVTENGTSDAVRFYVNGVAGSAATTNSETNNNGIWRIGSHKNAGIEFFEGIMDEVRFSATAHSADWIATEYNNQSSPSTFYSYGATQAETRQDSSGNPVPAVKSRGGVKFR